MDHHFYPLKIVQVIPETADTISLQFESHSAFSTYIPGQFLTLKANIGGESIRRAYSLSSHPTADQLPVVTIKKIENGKMSSWLFDQAKPGLQLEVMPPTGNFVFQPNTSKKRWFMLFAAGSGITPIFSILKGILHSEPQSFVSLLYGSRSQDNIIFKDQLDNLVLKYPGRLKVVHTLSQPKEGWFGETGRISEPVIQNTLEYLKPVTPFVETQVFTCGPQDMMDTITQIVISQGVQKENIHRESFSSSVDELTKQTTLEKLEILERNVIIHLDGDRFEVTVPVGKTILDAALDADVDMPYSCQSGLCTACRGKCLSGKVHMDEREGLSDEEMEEGYVLTCVGHPLTADVELEMG
ncbi:MAG TPA: ferredoxin--NADP reductase [Catalimonadaceae bacterium]|jgi:ring-1,2-phenylacetyl-CoA epoxidase subunit PaaE|nr:ferredoxin--NADP reductase [Catalimonadaceae bacterium]